MKWIAYGLLLFAMGLGAAWLLSEQGPDSVRGPAKIARDVRAERTHATLEGGASKTLRPATDATDPGADGSPAGGAAATAEGRRVVLAGRVLGWDRSLPGELELTVQVLSEDGPSQSWRVPSDVALSDKFEFSVDLSDLLAKGDAELEVSFDHAAYLHHATRLHSGEAQAGRLFVEVALQRAGIILGRVENEAGRGVAGADVGVFLLKDGTPIHSALEAAQTKEDGSYRLRVGAPGRYLVAARQLDLVPAATEVELVPGTSVAIDALILGEGVSIQGTVRYAGEPLARAIVDLALTADEAPLSLGRGGAIWKSGCVHHRYLQITCGDDGRYTFRGLTPGSYRIVVSGGTGLLLHFEDIRNGGREVMAPAAQVDFDVDALRLIAEFQINGRPLAGLHVWLNSLVKMEGPGEDGFGVFGLHEGNTDKDGRTTVLVSRGGRYVFGVDGEGYENDTESFVTPTEGTQHHQIIRVKRKPERPKLHVRWIGSGAEKLGQAGFGFYLVGRGPDQQTAHPVRSVACSKGQCLLEDLLPGRWTLIVRPGRSWYEGFSHYAEHRLEVDVPTKGTQEIRIPLLPGGMLRLTVKDGSGRLLGPRCTILDPEGVALDATFSVRSVRGITMNLGGLFEDAPSRLMQTLAPGVYEVRFTLKGYLPKTVRTRIEAGRTTALETTLEPAR